MMSGEARLSRLWSIRFDGEWTRLSGTPAPAGQEYFSNYQDLRALGVSLNGVVRYSAGRLTPYLLAGIGAYRLQRVDAPASVYGTTPALQAGFGIDGNLWGRVDLFVEARAMVHLTDYGSSDFMLTTYWPILVGLRIR